MPRAAMTISARSSASGPHHIRVLQPTTTQTPLNLPQRFDGTLHRSTIHPMGSRVSTPPQEAGIGRSAAQGEDVVSIGMIGLISSMPRTIQDPDPCKRVYLDSPRQSFEFVLTPQLPSQAIVRDSPI